MDRCASPDPPSSGVAPSSRPVALVTGASRGVGRAIALALAGAGYALALVGRDPAALTEVADACAALGAAARPYPADLGQLAALPALVDQVAADLGGLAVVVHNAGIFVEKPFEQTTTADFLASFQVNFFAVTELTRAALPHLDRAIASGQRGALLHIGSIAAARGYARGTIYTATKAALRLYAESLFLEVRERGISVSVIEPGVIDTEMHKGDARYAKDKMIQPADIAALLTSLLAVPQTACPLFVTVHPQRDPRDLRPSA